ncbi:MAG: DNA topoisomerase [Candidatus Asgardarchaeia archaeon]
MAKLLIAEKYKAGKKIASALGRVSIERYYDIPILKVNDGEIYVLPLRGHISTYTTIEEFSKWKNRDPRELITDESTIIKVFDKDIINYKKTLSLIAPKCSEVIIATDADEEGENIGLLEGYEIVSQIRRLPVKRMWLHTLVPQDIRVAFHNLIEPKWSWAYAVEARRIIDAVIGFSSTRELTLALERANLLRKMGTHVASIGRVQSALLYQIYLKEKEIKEFVPTPFWNIFANIDVKEGLFKFKYENAPIWNEFQAREIYQRVSTAKTAYFKNKEVKLVKSSPPTPLNITKALRLLSKELKITAEKALRSLEDLYLEELITYPRTDTDKYSESFNHAYNIKKFASHPIFGQYAEKLISLNKFTPNNGKKFVGDHEPIPPIAPASPQSKKFYLQVHWNAYEFIVRHYLALFYDAAEIERGTLRVVINGEPFIISGQRVVNEGYFEVYPYSAPKTTPLPPEQEKYPIQKISLKKDKTKPPPRYTESELISLMERLNLGTKSTRPEMIEINKRRRYITRKGQTIRITPIGWALMEVLEKIWPEFLDPAFTAHIEKLLHEIMQGKISYDNAVRQVREQFLELFDKLRLEREKLIIKMSDAVFENIRQESLVECPECKSPMLLKKGKNNSRYLKCINCGKVLFLPKRGTIKKTKYTCKICGFPVLKISLKTKDKKTEYYLCPVCYQTRGPCFKCTEQGCVIKKL